MSVLVENEIWNKNKIGQRFITYKIMKRLERSPWIIFEVQLEDPSVAWTVYGLYLCSIYYLAISATIGWHSI